MKQLKKKHYIIGSIALVVIIGIGFAWTIYRKVYAPFSAMASKQILYIDADDTADSVCSKLQPMATERGMSGFELLARHYNYDTRLRTGRYAIMPEQKAIDVFRMLRNGQQEPVMLTIPEVRTMDRMAGKLGRKMMIDSLSIVLALTNQDYCQQLGYDTTTIACLFIPNTYEVYWNTSLDKLMQRLQKEHDTFWNEERRAKATALGLSPNEVSTLASIIDEETANNDEKPMVAGMYLNRLEKGMLLQADPTVKFSLGDFSLRRILNKHLEVDNPYNTYKYPGLPPGPIRVPSVQGLEAVLNPVHSDYLYMCAKEDFSGTHNFARTLSEHMQNARRYQQALNQRGIK